MGRGLLGKQFGGSRVPKENVLEFRGAIQTPWERQNAPQVAPKKATHEPKRCPEHLQEHISSENVDLS